MINESVMQIFQVEIANTGEVIVCQEDNTVLSAMEQLGRKGIPVGCRGGGCGVCKVRITSGDFITKKMSREHVSEDEEARGVVLACRLFPRSDLKLEVEGKMEKAINRQPDERVTQFWQQQKQRAVLSQR